MRERVVTMYYCGFCKKKGQRRHVMVRHEQTCMRNPLRQCGMCKAQYVEGTIAKLVDLLMSEGLVGLRSAVDDCPSCTVIAVNAALKAFHDKEPLVAVSESPAWYKEAVGYDYAGDKQQWWHEVNREQAAVYYGC